MTLSEQGKNSYGEPVNFHDKVCILCSQRVGIGTEWLTGKDGEVVCQHCWRPERTLTKGQKVQYTFYGKPETATITRVANGLVWLDNGRWMHAASVTPVAGRSKAARAQRLGTSISYRVDLIGLTWGGFTGTYSYTFDDDPSAKEIRSKAGDFQTIDDYKVTADIRTQLVDGYQLRHKIVEPWKRKKSELQFMAANEGVE